MLSIRRGQQTRHAIMGGTHLFHTSGRVAAHLVLCPRASAGVLMVVEIKRIEGPAHNEAEKVQKREPRTSTRKEVGGEERDERVEASVRATRPKMRSGERDEVLSVGASGGE